MGSSMEYDLFLSYSRYSYDIAAKISLELEKYGLLVWFDRTDVMIGSNIFTNLSKVLNKAKDWLGILLLIDKTYFNKEWCIKELELSIQNGIQIYPLLNSMEKSDIPEKYSFLRLYNMVTLRSENDIEYAVNKILTVLLGKYIIPSMKISIGTLFDKLLSAYNYHTRVDVEKVICADNLMRFIECKCAESCGITGCLHANVIHNKCSKLYNTGQLSHFEIKLVCHAIDIVLENVKPIQ